MRQQNNLTARHKKINPELQEKSYLGTTAPNLQFTDIVCKLSILAFVSCEADIGQGISNELILSVMYS